MDPSPVNVRYLFAASLAAALADDGRNQKKVAGEVHKVLQAGLERNGRAQSDGDLEEGTGFSQATLSEWARGASLPQPDDVRLPALAKVIDREDQLELWQRQLTDDHARRADVGVLPLSRHLLSETEELVERSESGLHIWILNPGALPLLQEDSSRVVELWAQNLYRGINYCIVWSDDVTTPDLLKKFGSKIESIANRLAELVRESAREHQHKDLGVFQHFIVSMQDGPASAQRDPALRHLQRLENGPRDEHERKAWPKHTVFEVTPAKKPELEDIRRGLHEYLTTFAAVVCYVWPRSSPVANVCLKKVRLPCDESNQYRDVGLWLDHESSAKLKYDLEHLRECSSPKWADWLTKDSSSHSRQSDNASPSKGRST